MNIALTISAGVIIVVWLLIFGLAAYVLWAEFWPKRRRRRRELPDRIDFGASRPPLASEDIGDLTLQPQHGQYDLYEIAKAIGFDPAPEADSRLEQAVKRVVHRYTQELSGGTSDWQTVITEATISDVIHRHSNNGRLTICSLRWSEEKYRRGWNNRPVETKPREQTVVLYEGNPPTNFPEFGTQRKSERFKRLLPVIRLFTRHYREPRVSDPEFSSRIFVGTPTPKLVRPLLTATVRELLIQQPDVQVSAAENYLAVYRPRISSPCPAWPKSSFIRKAVTIIDQICIVEKAA